MREIGVGPNKIHGLSRARSKPSTRQTIGYPKSRTGWLSSIYTKKGHRVSQSMSDGLDIYHPNSRRHLCTTVHRCPLEDHSSPVRQGVKSYFKGLLFGVNIYIILYAHLSGDDMNWEPTRWQDVKGLPEGARVQTTSRQR